MTRLARRRDYKVTHANMAAKGTTLIFINELLNFADLWRIVFWNNSVIMALRLACGIFVKWIVNNWLCKPARPV